MLKTVRHNRNSIKFNFICNNKIEEDDSFIDFGENCIIIHPKQIGNIGCWVHEFTEASIIKILNSNSFRKPWKRTLYFKDYKPSTVSHLISVYGIDNGRNLEPQTNMDIPEW